MQFRWWIVGTTFVVQLFMVGLYTYGWGMLAKEVAADLDSNMLTMNYAMTAAGLVGLALPPIAGPLVDRWSARGLMFIGVASLFLALVGMSLAWSPLAFVCTAALFLGVGGVLLGPMTGSAVITRWFTEMRGRALGISAIGTSAGGVVLPLVMGWGFGAIGWRQTLQLIALGVALFVVPLLLFRFRDHPDPDRDEGAVGDRTAAAQSEEAAGEPPRSPTGAVGSSAEILRRSDFWVMTVALSLFIMCYTSTLANLPAFAGDAGLDDASIGRMMALLAFCGGVGKLIFGELIDRMPLRIGLWAAMGATMLGLGLFSSEPSPTVMMLAAVAMGAATGGLLPVWNAMVAAVFGVANFGRVMGLMGPVIGLVVSPGFTLIGAIRESAGSYVPAFHLFIGVLLAASGLLVFLRIPGRDAAG